MNGCRRFFRFSLFRDVVTSARSLHSSICSNRRDSCFMMHMAVSDDEGLQGAGQAHGTACGIEEDAAGDGGGRCPLYSPA